jgi:hypothetical protein
VKPIALTQGQVSIVDDEDADLASLNWCATKHKNGKTFYAKRGFHDDQGGQVTQLLHRVVAGRMGIDGEVDHKDHDGLNNRRSNLRSATSQQNKANQGLRLDNTSGVKGVSWCKQTGKWRAKIKVNGQTRHLGRFDDKQLAEATVRDAREKTFGEFACHG